MKRWVLLLLFMPIFSFSQKDTTRFIDNLNLEFNLGACVLKYGDLTQGQDPDVYWFNKQTSFLSTFNISLNYLNNYFKIGLKIDFWTDYKGALVYILFFSTKGSINLFPKNAEKIFFGPSVQFGMNHRHNLGRTNLCTGLDLYKNNFHFGVYYGWTFEPVEKSSYQNVRNINIEVGYMFDLRRKKKK